MIFLDEEISTAGAMGIMQIQIMISMFQSEKEIRKERRVHYETIIGKEKFEKVQQKMKDNKNVDKKIYGYDYIDGKYQVNEKEATNIKNRIEKEIITAEKEENRRKANKSRSEKMKALWEDEEYRKGITERIRIAKRLKNLRNER